MNLHIHIIYIFAFLTHPVLKLIRYLLFAIINYRGISKSDQTIVNSKEWRLVNGKSFKNK